jgi:hypothetical protein
VIVGENASQGKTGGEHRRGVAFKRITAAAEEGNDMPERERLNPRGRL